MRNTEQSAALYKRACESLAMGVSTAFRCKVTAVPITMERGAGPCFYDVDGNEFIDYGLAWGPLIVGNNHPQLSQAITEQLARGYTFGAQHRGETVLAEKMVSLLPGVDRVIFSNTGSEAVQAALRLARGFTGREKFIKFEGHYNGWLNNVLVSSHPQPEQFGKTVGDCGGQPEAEYSLTVTCPWNNLAALEQVFRDNPGQIAAVIGEPILVNGGSCMPNEGYLAAMIELCREHGAVSIFDEVITGFRIALGGAREYFGLQPDLSVYAKAMGGGFSISAVGGRREVFDALLDGRTGHFGTYNGNPISVAAAIATIDILSEPGTFERIHRHGYALREAMESAAKENGVTLVTSGTGAAFHVHFGLQRPPRCIREAMQADQAIGDRFRERLFERGLYCLPAGRWYVGAAHGEEQLQQATGAIREAMQGL
ncbi:MAG: aspartate aminotransferase family protein [Planctomycetales bacterium]|nr:aspartate aminotransferase family protein [Planctomycetales bacterium]